jgi:beta-glucosidase
MIGPNAYPGAPVGGGSAQVRPFGSVSFLEGMGGYLGSSATVLYARGIPTLSEMAATTNFQTAPQDGKEGLTIERFDNSELSGAPVSTTYANHVNLNGVRGDESLGLDALLAKRASSSRWTGYYLAQSLGAYKVFVQWNGERSGFRLFVDDKKVFDDWDLARALVDQATLQLAAGPHKVVLEQYKNDRLDGLRLRLGIQPVQKIVSDEAKALAKKADVVVLAVGFEPDTESEGSDRTFQLPPGQDELIQEIAAANPKTAVVITAGGNVDMNGWAEQVPALLHVWYAGQEGGVALTKIVFGDVNPSGHLPVTFERRWEDNPVHDSYYPDAGTNKIVYREGLFVGYRGYEHNKVKPRFPFGYGLSYTTFGYANLKATPTEVSFDVTNTGSREGSAVPQLYIGDMHASLPRPAKELKGFAKVSLKPGETRHVTLPLNDRSFSYYDVGAKQWKASSGAYEVLVGDSSENILLKGSVNR